MDRIELPVGGVTCGGCAGRVSNALLAVPGVTTAVVNDDRTMVAIEGAALERTTLIGAIEGAVTRYCSHHSLHSVLPSPAMPVVVARATVVRDVSRRRHEWDTPLVPAFLSRNYGI